MKLYFILAAVIAAISGLSWGGYALYQAGRNAEIAAQAAAIEGLKKDQRRLIDELATVKAKERIVIKEKIKVIREANDACADVAISPAILSQLRD